MTTVLHGLNIREQEFFGAFSHLLQNFEDLDGKFSLWKVHNHFPIGQDEVLHETSDSNKRESTTQVIKASLLPENAFVSQWIVRANGCVEAERWCCD